MSRDKLVIVGASLAGLRAAEAARKAGFEGAVTLIGAERHLPYDRPPLSKAYLDGNDSGASPQPPVFRAREVLTDELGIELVLGAAAAGLDTARRVIETDIGSIRYDSVVIATGATARELPGTSDMAGVHTLRTIDDAEAVRAALNDGARTVIIGAGFIGSEIASCARKRGLDVTVIEAMPTPVARAVGSVMGEVCAALHRRNGTDLRCGIGVTGLEGNGHVKQVRLSDGSTLRADLVVVGVGAVPATEWLQDCGGLRLDDGIVCDETLSTGVEGVYAAGDVARWYNPLFGRTMRLEHWTSAAEQGAAAARNAVNPGLASPYQTVPYFWSDWYDSRIQFVGISDADEVRVVDDRVERDGRCVALYREGERLVGALTINGQSEIMKYRRLIAQQACWTTALDFANARRSGR